jgi:hypothetical protein
MVCRVTTRRDDERLLEWLRLHDEGVSSREIGRRYGVPGTGVYTVLDRVRKADAAAHQEAAR